MSIYLVIKEIFTFEKCIFQNMETLSIETKTPSFFRNFSLLLAFHTSHGILNSTTTKPVTDYHLLDQFFC